MYAIRSDTANQWPKQLPSTLPRGTRTMVFRELGCDGCGYTLVGEAVLTRGGTYVGDWLMQNGKAAQSAHYTIIDWDQVRAASMTEVGGFQFVD